MKKLWLFLGLFLVVMSLKAQQVGSINDITNAGSVFHAGGDPLEAYVTAERAKYILVINTKEVDPFVASAVYCYPSKPDCGTVYRTVQTWLPFDTLEGAKTYLEVYQAEFVALFELSPVKVTVKETTVETPQLPIRNVKKTYTVHGVRP